MDKFESIKETLGLQGRKASCFAVILVFIALSFFHLNAISQSRPLDFPQILNAANKINQAKGEQKKLLYRKVLSDIRQRGVGFRLNEEESARLRFAGASNEFIRAIAENYRSPKNPAPARKLIEGGVVNGKAVSLPKPAYPAAAKAARASGSVNVEVLIDENGNVVSAKAISGHTLLRAAAEKAAMNAKFSPTLLSGKPVKVSGIMTYNFTLNADSYRNSFGMEFIKIPYGSFQMGSENGAPDEKPLLNLTFSGGEDGIWIGKTEVTQGQWKAIMGSNPSYFQNCGDSCPVENISWVEAQAFIKKLNEKSTEKYRLPIEAEWEYAARSGSKGKYSFGDDANMLGDYGWFAGNSEKKSHPVASKKPNEWGLYDMHGNVWEWCENWYGPYSISNLKPPEKGTYRTVRGGGWASAPENARSAIRTAPLPDYKNIDLGFRLLMIPSR